MYWGRTPPVVELYSIMEREPRPEKAKGDTQSTEKGKEKERGMEEREKT